jgi:DNA-binding GntR family transcriptional regulator
MSMLEVARSGQNRGCFLQVEADSEAFRDIALPRPEEEPVYRLIASERFANLIGDQVSVGELVRRYSVSRTFILKVLARMQKDGLVEKTAGHGWAVGPALIDEAAYQESCAYRLPFEPAGPPGATGRRSGRRGDQAGPGGLVQLAAGARLCADRMTTTAARQGERRP